MSPARRLGLFQTGDLIIVPDGGAAPLRLRPQLMRGLRAGIQDGKTSTSRTLLRNLIAARRGGKK